MPDSGKPAGLHFSALSCTTRARGNGQKVKRGGLGRAPGRGGGNASTQHQTSLLLSLFCRWSCSQRGAEAAGWMGRPSKYFLSSSQPVSCAASVPAAVPHGRIHSNRVTRCHVMPGASERSRSVFFSNALASSHYYANDKYPAIIPLFFFFFNLELENERKLSLPRNYSPAFSVNTITESTST